MNTDFSRQRFNSWNDFSGVLQQQGRVLLDAEWNELVEILDRRFRAGTIDIIGRGVVPKQTPHAFELKLTTGPKKLTIGPGRMYVDGLLAENHGQAPKGNALNFDPALSELRGTDPIDYTAQPYYPKPPPLPESAGPHLVYLDVWQREATNLEIPALVEQAVGVETTTRIQTVWQVRVLENPRGGALACDTPDRQIPGWLELTAPSAGRLTTAATGVPSVDDPCILPPTGGYRSVENRCYRVEIHSVDPGTGAATFKWARDNRSMTAAITAVPAPNQVVVDRVGFDSVLRFNAGDWVEITDDVREFSGQPGIIARIAQPVDEATRTLMLSVNLNSADFPTDAQHLTDPSRHMRIRKWDHSGLVRDSNGTVVKDLNSDNTGVIPVKTDGTAILVEDGIQITFSLAAVSGRFRVGDYWVFAARTADASVEILKEAPPRGVHHHYCRLGFLIATGVSDCRQFWPPDFGDDCCGCTVCVTPELHGDGDGELTIQHAIDKVAQTGGTVCLAPGHYRLPDTLKIEGARSVRLRGQGSATILTYTPTVDEAVLGNPAILIQDVHDFVMADLAVNVGVIRADATLQLPVIGVMGSRAQSCAQVTIEHCLIDATARRETEGLSTGTAPAGNWTAMALRGFLEAIEIRENVMIAGSGVADWPRTKKKSKVRGLSTNRLRIEDNFFFCRASAVSLLAADVHAGPGVVARNIVFGCQRGGIAITGSTDHDMGGSFDVCRNVLRVVGDGIVMGSSDIRINDNDVAPYPSKTPVLTLAILHPLVTEPGATATGAGSAGIVLVEGPTEEKKKVPLEHCHIIGNRIRKVTGNGIDLRGVTLMSAMIKQNIIEGVLGSGIVMDEASSAVAVAIENNQIRNITPRAGFTRITAGIQLQGSSQVGIAHNSILGIGGHNEMAIVAGILLIKCREIKVSDNDLADIAPPEAPFAIAHAGFSINGAFGIFVVGSAEGLELAGNSIRRTAARPFNKLAADDLSWCGIYVEGRAAGEIALIRGNVIEAAGRLPAVFLRVGGVCMFDGNQCRWKSGNEKEPAVLINAHAATLNSNYIEHSSNGIAAALFIGDMTCVILGNLTRGSIQLNNAVIGSAVPLNATMP